MKKFYLILLICSFYNTAFAQIEAKVDERFELTSIIFRLNGNAEYNMSDLKVYTDDIDNYFAKYKNHELIKFINKNYEQYGWGFDAVAQTACVLSIKNNTVSINPDIDLNYFYKEEPRWDKIKFPEFVRLLDKFYKDTRFNTFFLKHKNFYQLAEKNLNKILLKMDWDWYDSFFGHPIANAFVIVSMANGRSNYAAKTKNNKNQVSYYAVIGSNATDNNNVPIFKNDKSTIVHEFCHLFVDSVVKKNMKELIKPAQNIYPQVESIMKQYSYNYDTVMLYETFTRLATNLNPDAKKDNYNITYDEQKGFIWMRDMVNFYYSFHPFFQTMNFEDKMPQLIEYMNYLADTFDNELLNYNNRYPFIKSVYPAINSIIDIFPKQEIAVKFSLPMRQDLYGLNKNKNDTTAIFPKTMGGHWADEYTFIIPVSLEYSKKYSIVLPFSAFESSNCYKMKKDFVITFETKIE